MVITEADVIAVKRAHEQGGNDAAMTELRRRFLGLTDRNADKVLYSVLGRQIDPPPPFREERDGKVRG